MNIYRYIDIDIYISIYIYIYIHKYTCMIINIICILSLCFGSLCFIFILFFEYILSLFGRSWLIWPILLFCLTCLDSVIPVLFNYEQCCLNNYGCHYKYDRRDHRLNINTEVPPQTPTL